MEELKNVRGAQQSMAEKEFATVLMEAAAAEGMPQPPEDQAEYEEWIEKVTQRMANQAIKEGFVQGKNEDGTHWCMVIPDPVFVIKAKNKNCKVFVNICSSDKIAEPQPVGDIEDPDADLQWRIPLSCGQARVDKDKEGRPCTVYDVIYNDGTLDRASKEADFKQLVIALALSYLKQKYEPDLSEKWTLPKMKCKGTPANQRVRVDAPVEPKETTLGDSGVKLPDGNLKATHTPAKHGGPLIKELDETRKDWQDTNLGTTNDEPEADMGTSGTTEGLQYLPMPEHDINTLKANSLVDLQPTSPAASCVPDVAPPPSAPTVPATQATHAGVVSTPAGDVFATTTAPSKEEEQLTYNLVCQGAFDWVHHGMEAHEDDEMPEAMVIEIVLPAQLSMKDIGSDVQAQKVEIVNVSTRQLLLNIDLPYLANEQDSSAKFFKKRHVLQMYLPVDGAKQVQLDQARRQKEAEVLDELDREAATQTERARELHERSLGEKEAALSQERREAEERKQQEALDAAEAAAREHARQEKGAAALKYAEESAQRATAKRRAMIEKLRGKQLDEDNEDDIPGDDTSKDNFDSTTFGNVPKRMKDTFGIEFKNRYLFALDTDL
mmetsp:Transcript_111113/g.192702  ORF Transcript_111113/g.192702 Transcript_111113/m.192702 type:complete len:608 (-) Transcript_111113:869-2692(-)